MTIGGSLLPSSDARILRAVKTPFGTLQVRPIVELDTHGLFHNDSLLVTHPNGYSCHVLLERMVKREVDRAVEQVNYILDCGGTARHMTHIVNSMNAS